MRGIYALPILLFLLLAGILGWRLLSTHPSDVAVINQPLPDFSLPMLYDEGTLDKKTLSGQVYLLHFFASWCTSCVAEREEWQSLRAQTGFKRYAIAWNDPPIKTRQWLEKHGNAFDDVLVDENGKFGVSLGITGIPETMLVNAQGTIVWRWNAPLTQDVIRKQLLPLIASLTHAP